MTEGLVTTEGPPNRGSVAAIGCPLGTCAGCHTFAALAARSDAGDEGWPHASRCVNCGWSCGDVTMTDSRRSARSTEAEPHGSVGWNKVEPRRLERSTKVEVARVGEVNEGRSCAGQHAVVQEDGREVRFSDWVLAPKLGEYSWKLLPPRHCAR
jgi:hypothetical protein